MEQSFNVLIGYRVNPLYGKHECTVMVGKEVITREPNHDLVSVEVEYKYKQTASGVKYGRRNARGKDKNAEGKFGMPTIQGIKREVRAASRVSPLTVPKAGCDSKKARTSGS